MSERCKVCGCYIGTFQEHEEHGIACKHEQTVTLKSELAALRAQCEWREVTETEPAQSEAVWLCDNEEIWIGLRFNAGWERLTSEIEIIADGRRFDSEPSIYHTPTHWLPLPELPKETP